MPKITNKEKEISSDEEVDLTDMDESVSDGHECGIDKEALKAALKECKMEDSLKYTVSGRTVEELQMLIKMAQAKIKEIQDKKAPNGDDDKTIGMPSDY